MDGINETGPVEPAAAPITVEALDALVEQAFAKRVEIEAFNAQLTEKNKELMRLDAQITAALKDLNREDYKSRAGTVTLSTKWRVNLPQTDQDKKEFFDWLRERGIFDKFATVNSNSLNSLYMAEWEAAKKRGEGMEFSVPGIGPAKSFQGVGYYKTRKAKAE